MFSVVMPLIVLDRLFLLRAATLLISRTSHLRLLVYIRLVNPFAIFTWVFFFQAEDGIRDATVTGVQTCALPIYLHVSFERYRDLPLLWPEPRFHRPPGHDRVVALVQVDVAPANHGAVRDIVFEPDPMGEAEDRKRVVQGKRVVRGWMRVIEDEFS